MIRHKLHKKNKSGVMLIEVIIALAIGSIFLVGALGMQGKLLTSTARYGNEIRAAIAIKNTFYEAEKDTWVEQKKTTSEAWSDSARLTIKYVAERPTDASSLRDIPGLVIERGSTSWNINGQQRTYKMIQVRYVPEK